MISIVSIPSAPIPGVTNSAPLSSESAHTCYLKVVTMQDNYRLVANLVHFVLDYCMFCHDYLVVLFLLQDFDCGIC